jgi:uncharacterized membrane protein HdeD (DUF308 family)
MNIVAAFSNHSDPLQIWEPTTSGFIMGMADVIAGYRPLAAYFTSFCHGKTP